MHFLLLSVVFFSLLSFLQFYFLLVFNCFMSSILQHSVMLFGASTDLLTVACVFYNFRLNLHPVSLYQWASCEAWTRDMVLQQGFTDASVKGPRVKNWDQFLHKSLRLGVLKPQVQTPNPCEGRSWLWILRGDILFSHSDPDWSKQTSRSSSSELMDSFIRASQWLNIEIFRSHSNFQP